MMTVPGASLLGWLTICLFKRGSSCASSCSSAGAGATACGAIWVGEGGRRKAKRDSALAVPHDSATAPISAANPTGLDMAPLVGFPSLPSSVVKMAEGLKWFRDVIRVFCRAARNDLPDEDLTSFSRLWVCASRQQLPGRCQWTRNKA